MKKKCGKCNDDKLYKEFHKNSNNKKDGLAAWCKTCHLKHKKKHYVENKEAYAKNILNHKKWFIDLKISLKCERCGFKHPAALDFHHKDPSQKEFPINYGNFGKRSKEEIMKEIAKCEILCSNCHRIEHSTVYNNYMTS